jgi:glycosyltransferase involved in cell wall biosynthesis
LNVLFVIHYPVFGGPHNQALHLARVLEERGVSLTVLLPDERGFAAKRLRDQGVDVVTIPLHRGRVTFNPRTHLKLVTTLRREVGSIREIIRTRKIDVVQIGGLVNPHGAIAGRLENSAVIWQLLDTRAPMAFRRLMMPLVVRLSDVVMTTGQAVARVHPGAQGMGNRLLVFFPPVDPEQFAIEKTSRRDARLAFGFSSDDLVLGTVGNLNPQKGHEYFLEAAALARSEGRRVKILVVGASHDTHRAYERHLYRLCGQRNLVIGRDVVFAGALADVRPALAAMDIFVLSSVPRSEGAPTAVQEAMMMNRAVVAANVGAVSEVVQDGVTGLIVPPLDPPAMARAIMRLADAPTLMSAMGVRGRKRAAIRYSAEECARIHLEAYGRALTRRDSFPRPRGQPPSLLPRPRRSGQFDRR